MIKENKELLELLVEAEKLAADQDKRTGPGNLDLSHIRAAIEVVKMRIGYHESKPKEPVNRETPPNPAGTGEGEKGDTT